MAELQERTGEKTLGEILELRKSIPEYQRDFVWEESDADICINDLYDSYTSSREREYFFGSMIFFHDEESDRYEIVDGQQRITVIYTLIAEILRALDEKGEKISEHRGRYICKTEGVIQAERKIEYLLIHRDKKIRKYLEKIGKGEDITGTDTQIDPGNISENLNNCRNFIRRFVLDKIEQKNGLKDIAGFYKYLTKRVKAIYFNAPNISYALEAYIRLNSRGKILGHLEIIKGYLFAEANKMENIYEWDELEKNWDRFWKKFREPIQIGGKGKYKELINDDTFLAYYFFVKKPELLEEKNYPDDFLPNKKISEFLFEEDVKADVFADPKGFVETLENFTDKIIELRSGKKHAEYSDKRLIDIALLSQTQIQPLLFLLTCRHIDDADLFQAAVEIAFRWVFVFTVSVTSSGTTSKAWRKLSRFARREYDKNLRGDALAESVKREAQKELKSFWREHFRPVFLNLKIKTHKTKVKAVLAVTEIAMRSLAGIEGEENFYSHYYRQRGLHVDHLSPESISLLNEDKEDFAQKIGNAAFLDSSANTSIQDARFGSEGKKRALKNSKFFLTKSVVLDEGDISGPKNQKAVSLISKIDEMSPKAIEKREQKMLEVLEEYFEIKD